MALERQDLHELDRIELLVDVVPQGEVFRDRVVLEASVKDLDHVVISRWANKHLEVFEVADMGLLKLAKGDVGHYGGSLQLEDQELRWSVGV